MSVKTLQDAFVDELQDVLSAEKQIRRALKKMVKNAQAEELQNAFREHLEQTEGQIERLEEAFDSLDRSPRSKHCDAMAGILEEGEEILEEAEEPVLDAMLIAAAQKVEHYEIATYGTLCTWAKLLGHGKAEKLLQETLSEEKETDEKLSKLAAELNKQAQPA